MNFHGKDAPLNASIQTMKAVLTDMECHPIFAEEKHPLQSCFSVNLISTEAPNHIYVNGKGSISQASIASAYGEYIERLQTNLFFMDFYLGNRPSFPDECRITFDEPYLDDALRQIYDPEGELSPEDLVDYNSDHEEHIVALPFIRQHDGASIPLPVNILNNLYVSNGLATGNSPEEAKVQALSEIFERYVKFKIIREGYALPTYPETTLRTFTTIYDDIISLRDLGYTVEVLDASLGGQFPVTAIALINPKTASLFVSFGAHPLVEVALERTMTELMQGRDLNSLDSFETPTFDMGFVADSFNIESHFIDSNGKIGFDFLRATKSFAYTPWAYSGQGCQEEYAYLSSLADGLKRDIYIREYTYLGFYSCQIIIPKLSEVYPIDDLVYNNRNRGKWLRKMVLHPDSYEPQEILEELAQIDETIQVDQYIGVIFKHPFTILELKSQLQIQAGDMEEALASLEFTKNELGLIVAELIRMQQRQLDFQEYQDGLFKIYGQARTEQAVAILAGNASLLDLTFHQDYLNILALYDRLNSKKEEALRR